jgi:hypothetical protein
MKTRQLRLASSATIGSMSKNSIPQAIAFFNKNPLAPYNEDKE